jgi:hypothetical protein
VYVATAGFERTGRDVHVAPADGVAARTEGNFAAAWQPQNMLHPLGALRCGAPYVLWITMFGKPIDLLRA